MSIFLKFILWLLMPLLGTFATYMYDRKRDISVRDSAVHFMFFTVYINLMVAFFVYLKRGAWNFNSYKVVEPIFIVKYIFMGGIVAVILPSLLRHDFKLFTFTHFCESSIEESYGRLKIASGGYILFYLIVCIFLLVFFIQAHPMVIFNSDDIHLLYYNRVPLPIDKFEPSRVFPPTLMPLCTTFAVYFIYPFIHDFVISLLVAYAIVFVSFIMTMYMLFASFLKVKLNVTKIERMFTVILFVLCSFLIFRTKEQKNEFLFWAANTTCVFYYIIPAIFNITLVLFLEKRNTADKKSVFYSGLLFLWIYLAIFSNTFLSIISAVYAGVTLFISFVLVCLRKQKPKKYFPDLLYQHFWEILILVLWVISLVCEIRGGRAAQLNSRGNFFNYLKVVIKTFLDTPHKINRTFIIFSAIVIFYSLFIAVKIGVHTDGVKDFLLLILKFSMCCVLVLIHQILLSAKSRPSYFDCNEVQIAYILYVMLVIFISLAFIIRKRRYVTVILPILIFIISSSVYTEQHTFKEFCQTVDDHNNLIAWNQNWVNKIIDADKNNEDSIILEIPKFTNQSKNWPMNGNHMVSALYKAGLIRKPIKIQLVPNSELNVEYRMDKTYRR